jgi:hypothetical protein
MGSVLTSPYTTPTAVTSPRGFATIYAAPQYQSSFYAPLARVYGYTSR